MAAVKTLVSEGASSLKTHPAGVALLHLALKRPGDVLNLNVTNLKPVLDLRSIRVKARVLGYCTQERPFWPFEARESAGERERFSRAQLLTCSMMRLCPPGVGGRARAELGAKCMIEVGNVAETGC